MRMTDSQDLVDDRQASILKQLAADRRVFTNEAAAEFGVSVDTIRRDLRMLHKQGHLKRVHGGAVPTSTLPSSFTGRSSAGEVSTKELAAAVASRFRPGQVIGLDAGSTNVEVASAIPDTLKITIVTNNPAAALALADHPSATVILLGGRLDLTWMATVGSEVVEGWRNYRLDIGVLGVCGFDLAIGATSNSHTEVPGKRALIESSAETLMPLNPAKIGVGAPFIVAEAAQIQTIIIDQTANPCEPLVASRHAQVEGPYPQGSENEPLNEVVVVESAFTRACRSAGIHVDVIH